MIPGAPSESRHDAAPIERRRILDAIAERLAELEEVEVVYAIGSFVTERPFRDIDLAVWFRRAPGWQAPARVALVARMVVPPEVTASVDVIVLNDAESFFKEHVVDHGLLLFERRAGAALELATMARSEAIDLREWQRIHGIGG